MMENKKIMLELAQLVEAENTEALAERLRNLQVPQEHQRIKGKLLWILTENKS